MNQAENTNTTNNNDTIQKEEYAGLEATKNTNPNTETNQENVSGRKTSLNSQHNLNSNWVFWYISRKEKIHTVPYEERLKQITTFSTLEDFFRYYVHLKSASDIDRNSDLSIFKEGYKPLWESCPSGGCWFFRFKKNDDGMDIDLKWEKMLFALIGKIIYIIT